MIEFFKFCRITCDGCPTNFEVYTFEDTIEAPEGWKQVTIYNPFSQSSRLCCPACVSTARAQYSDPRDITVDSPTVRLQEERT